MSVWPLALRSAKAEGVGHCLCGRSQTGLVVQLRRREIEILHRAKEVESWGQDCAFFVCVYYGKERGFIGQPVRGVGWRAESR